VRRRAGVSLEAIDLELMLSNHQDERLAFLNLSA